MDVYVLYQWRLLKKQLHFYRPSRIISCENRISLRGGVRFSTGGKVREPRMRLIWRNSKTDSIVWMREEGYDVHEDV